MRKRLVFLVVLAMMMSIMTVPALAATEGTPSVIELYAGKNIPVGTVNVWDNESTLFVEYSIVDGWEMTEAHLSVSADKNSIPKTATGNPAPGHFNWSKTFDPAVKTYRYQIEKVNLGNIDQSALTIAAHAAVQHKTETDIAPTISWTRSSEDDPLTATNEVVSTPGYGGNWTYADVIQSFNAAIMTAVPWDSGFYEGTVRASYPYASWKYAYNNGGSYAGSSDLRLFRAEFSIPSGFEAVSATLGTPGNPDRIPINDNVYVYVNGELLFWGGTRLLGSSASQNITHEGSIVGVPAIGYNSGQQLETDGWYIPGTFPAITGLNTGDNKIEVFAEENQTSGGMGKLELNLHGMQIDQIESAWADGFDGARINPAPKGNWGTYFVYQCNNEN